MDFERSFELRLDSAGGYRYTNNDRLMIKQVGYS